MQVKLEKKFPIEAPASAGWKFLQDIPAMAACMPGAETVTLLAKSIKQKNTRSNGRPCRQFLCPLTMVFI